MIYTFAFYLFACVLIVSATLVVTVRNPVHAVLFLILAFFNAAGLFVLIGAEFVAMILVIVYVGAVAVLFLFVVMMLDIDISKRANLVRRHIPVGLFVGLMLAMELVVGVVSWVFVSDESGSLAAAADATPNVTNTRAIGQILYTDYLYLFQAAGIALLVAMIGAIVLTLRERQGVRRQVISHQVARDRAETISVRKIGVREGT